MGERADGVDVLKKRWERGDKNRGERVEGRNRCHGEMWGKKQLNHCSLNFS